jgi:pantoate--beta-alanine ligase
MTRSPPTVRTIPALRHALDRFRIKKATTALVPTMGSLHDGLVSPVRLAKRRARKGSTFVNPTRFAPSEGFSLYPLTRKIDVTRLTAENVELIWNPDVRTVHPPQENPYPLARRNFREKYRRQRFFPRTANVRLHIVTGSSL